MWRMLSIPSRRRHGSVHNSVNRCRVDTGASDKLGHDTGRKVKG